MRQKGHDHGVTRGIPGSRLAACHCTIANVYTVEHQICMLHASDLSPLSSVYPKRWSLPQVLSRHGFWRIAGPSIADCIKSVVRGLNRFDLSSTSSHHRGPSRRSSMMTASKGLSPEVGRCLAGVVSYMVDQSATWATRPTTPGGMGKTTEWEVDVRL